MQRKFDTAPNEHYIAHYGRLLQALDSDTAGDVLHDKKGAKLRDSFQDVDELKRLRREGSSLKGGLPTSDEDLP